MEPLREHIKTAEKLLRQNQRPLFACPLQCSLSSSPCFSSCHYDQVHSGEGKAILYTTHYFPVGTEEGKIVNMSAKLL